MRLSSGLAEAITGYEIKKARTQHATASSIERIFCPFPVYHAPNIFDKNNAVPCDRPGIILIRNDPFKKDRN